MSEEIWKDIEGYEGLYQVSNWGRVKSLHFNKEKIMKATKGTKYYKINLFKNKKQTTYLIHRLVAKAFIPNPNNLPEINHKDEKNLKNSNECNNNIENLEWVTAQENCNTPMRKQRTSGTNAHMAKSVMCEGIIFCPMKKCAEYYDIDFRRMSEWLLGTKPMPQEWIDKGLRYLD